MSHHLFLGRILFLPELLAKASLYTTCGQFFQFPHGLPGILIKRRSDDRNFKLLTRQHWIKFQLTPSIYINTELFFLVDWALLPLSTSTLVPLLVAGNCLPYHQLELLAIY